MHIVLGRCHMVCLQCPRKCPPRPLTPCMCRVCFLGVSVSGAGLASWFHVCTPSNPKLLSQTQLRLAMAASAAAAAAAVEAAEFRHLERHMDWQVHVQWQALKALSEVETQVHPLVQHGMIPVVLSAPIPVSVSICVPMYLHLHAWWLASYAEEPLPGPGSGSVRPGCPQCDRLGGG